MDQTVSPSEASRALHAQRKIVTLVCDVCGKAFEGYQHRSRREDQPTGRYCSTPCRSLANARRQKAQRQARRSPS